MSFVGINSLAEIEETRFLNDYNPECSPVSLYTQLFYQNRLGDVIFLLGVSGY